MSFNLPRMATIGCDPELFVRINGNLHSAHGLIPGNKKDPFKVPGGAVQVDGMALEFNVDPVGGWDMFMFRHRINRVMEAMKKMTPEGSEFVLEPVAVFDKQHFDAQPEEAKELGCDPDYNAWNGGEENPRPDNRTTMRTASGHIHVGFKPDDIPGDLMGPEYQELCRKIVKEMDVFLGIPSVLYDKDARRRSMYGKAGAFRYKPKYGVEYRVLSNVWLQSPNLTNFVVSGTRSAYEAVRDNACIHDIIGRDTIEHVINNSDVKMAKKICREYGIERA
jgi:hypothetical protein